LDIRFLRGTDPVLGIVFATILLLLVPLVAMQFTDEVSWSRADFAMAAALIFTTGMALVLGVKKARTRASRISVVALIMLIFATVWAELAVGLFR
jgi:hypothetical protein